MATPRLYGVGINLAKSELQNAALQNLSADPGSPATGQVYWSTTLNRLRIYNGTAWVSIGTPDGLDPKFSCRAITMAALPANTYANGTAGVGATLTGNANGALAAVDGITLVAADRVLVKNEVAGANNGIYTVTQVGSAGTPYILTRALDADDATELNANMFTFIEEGTANQDTGWVLATNNPIVIGTTALVFTQFSGPGSWTAGNGITITGTVISANYDGTTIGVTGGGALKMLQGRTYAATFGDAAATSFNIDHNLGTKDVHVQVRDAATDRQVECDVVMSTTNRVVLGFDTAPASNAYRVVVIG